MILYPETYRAQKVVVAGGGDSTLDWVLFLGEICSELTLVHRIEAFSAAPDSVSKVMKRAEEGKINLQLKSNLTSVNGDDVLREVSFKNSKTNEETTFQTDHLFPLFGLSPKPGPIENWGLMIDKSAIEVSTEYYSTNVEGIYAIGDINIYKNKLKLMLSGFHEAALMAHSAYKYIYPGVKYTIKYATVNGVNSF